MNYMVVKEIQINTNERYSLGERRNSSSLVDQSITIVADNTDRGWQNTPIGEIWVHPTSVIKKKTDGGNHLGVLVESRSGVLGVNEKRLVQINSEGLGQQELPRKISRREGSVTRVLLNVRAIS